MFVQKKNIILFLIAFFGISNFIESQDVKKYENDIIEVSAETSESDIDASSFIETLEYFRSHPIDVNKSKIEDFEKLGILTPFQIHSLIEYRQKHGDFLTVYELNGVDGLSVETVNELMPFVMVNDDNIELHSSEKRFWQMFLAGISRTLETQNGYKNIPDSVKLMHPSLYYLGNPYKVITKYQLENKNYQAGFKTEKDPGETWFSKDNRTFDFISGYAQLQNKRFLKNIIIGDYNARFGQGLVFWNGFAPGRSAMSINVKKVGQGFDHFASYNENRFMRGIAITAKIKELSLSTFFSEKKIDANVTSMDSSGNVTVVSSFETSGIHALPSEVTDEKVLGERIFGSNLTYDFGKLRVGSTLCNIHYDALVKKADELYNLMDFSGKNISAGSVDYLYRGRYFEVFGEAAMNQKNANATITGITCQPVPELSVAIIYRNYQPNFWMPYANAFGETGQPTNENGVYSGIEFVPIKNWKINAYADFFKFPWMKYRVTWPSGGSNYLIQTTYYLSESSSISVRYSYLGKMLDSASQSSELPITANTSLHKARIQTCYKASENVSLRHRFEFSSFSEMSSPSQNGYLFLQDIIWKPEKFHLSAIASYAVFSTESYNCRMYALESDVQYSYSIPALSGKGSRFYFLLRWNPIQNLSVSGRFSTTLYSDRNIISSGASEINGNHKSEAGFQFLLRF